MPDKHEKTGIAGMDDKERRKQENE